eukprot:CAMPEP_0201728464 /NCGR_PEP_ID=MMETSP0593-20130828/16022_1 /ASSEMBLY_ACC=CAM_ASM_000672 /TAXON_ID=267983 /ORGANISM="Skeletonema japonicum, Strain CCMP2506" /LENGTH=80 /DNA_ID=CAMNT_0048220579 /DNA_START=20 /DNA_END=259 /DNA_ORIENTATION=+
MASSEWLGRNPTSRKRSSYDSDWGTYEARAGGRSSWRASGALNRNNITAEGQRVSVGGVPHDNNHSRQQPQPQLPTRQHQ